MLVSEWASRASGVLRLGLQILASRVDDVLGETQFFKQQDEGVGEIELPPFVAVRRTTRKRVMIVVPTFTIVGKADDPVVAALVRDFVVAIAPEVRR